MPKSLEDLTTDELLAQAKSYQRSHNLVELLAANPETREATLRLLKKAKPDLQLPEIDAADRVRAEMAPERERLAALEQKMLERDARDNVLERRATIKTKYHLSDEDVKGVEALMIDKDNPIPTHDAAARVFLASRQSATTTPAAFMTPQRYDMPEKDVWGKGIGNKAALDRIAITEAANAMNEIFAGKGPGLGS